jgi:hypothetical protein
LKPIGKVFERGSSESVLTAPCSGRALLVFPHQGAKNAVVSIHTNPRHHLILGKAAERSWHNYIHQSMPQ